MPTYHRLVRSDRWGEPVYLEAADGSRNDPGDALRFERRLLLQRVESERAHLRAGTQGADPSPPAEILAWCEERLRELDRRQQLLEWEAQG